MNPKCKQIATESGAIISAMSPHLIFPHDALEAYTKAILADSGEAVSWQGRCINKETGNVIYDWREEDKDNEYLYLKRNENNLNILYERRTLYTHPQPAEVTELAKAIIKEYDESNKE